MNNKAKPVNIGNENFKTWLRKLDPISRVEKMSAIAKTQASAGLRGSLIKASLAQLSQRCQVMLIRLSDEDIKRYSRPKPAKRQVDFGKFINKGERITDKNINTSPSNQLKYGYDRTVKEDKRKIKGSTEYTKLKSLGNTQISLKTHVLTHEDTSTVKSTRCSKATLQENKGERGHVSNPTYSQTNTESSKKQLLKLNPSNNVKLKRKYQELFGDELDEIFVPENGSSKPNNRSENSREKNVNNYLNTTVNVTIVNSCNKTKSKNDTITATTNSLVDNNVLSGNDSSNKRLRIDVSLSNNDSKISNDNAVILERNYPEDPTTAPKKSHKERKRKKSAHKSKRCSGASKNKIKMSQSKTVTSVPPLALNTNCTEEDPSIKELWSILGMESPTDRSKNIKSFPLSSSNETITLHKAPEGIESNLQSEKNECGNVLENSTISKSHAPSIDENECLRKSGSSNPSESTKPTENGILQETNLVCRIAETFSLADKPTTASDSSEVATTCHSLEQNNSNTNKRISARFENEESSQLRSSINFRNDPDTIETILIPDDDDEETTKQCESKDSNIIQNSTQQNENILGHSKIGTIRVKSLGLLLNPQTVTDIQPASASDMNSSSGVKNTKDKLLEASCTENPIQVLQKEQHKPPTTVEERFCETYKFYFNSLVEKKIPKLGELLHLAVADGIRRNERIKRAEQLSSDDLILEEKQRADKDFNDMMKLRGQEFTPICELILRTFDQSSKLTLFVALFCRILRHAEEIDPTNKDNVIEARLVIYRMLMKHQFKDERIIECLVSDKDDFEEQVKLVSGLIDMAAGRKAESNNENNALQKQITVNPSHPSALVDHQRREQERSINITNILETQNMTPQRKSTGFSEVYVSGVNAGLPNSVIKPSVRPAPLQNTQPAIVNLPQRTTDVTKSHSGTSSGSQPVPKSNLGQRNLSTLVPTTMANLNNVTITPVPVGSFKSAVPLQSKPTTVIVNLPQTTTVTKPHTGTSGGLRAVLMSNSGQQMLSTSAPKPMFNSNNVRNASTVNFTLSPQSSVNRRMPQKSFANKSMSTNPSINYAPVGNSGFAPQDETHIVIQRLGTDLNIGNSQSKRSNPRLIVHEGTGSSSSMVESNNTFNMKSPPIIARKDANQNIHLSVAAAGRNVTNAYNMMKIVKNTGPVPTIVTSSENSQPTVTTTQSITSEANTLQTPITLFSILNSSSQSQVPSSSHCHPFVKRMPISGKMRMLFENKN